MYNTQIELKDLQKARQSDQVQYAQKCQFQHGNVDKPAKKEDIENKIWLINCREKLTVCVVPGPTGITVVTIIGCWLVTSII